VRDLSPAIRLIEEFEGFRPGPYKCSSGISTIGLGTTVYPDGTKVTLKDKPITHEQASEYLKAHMSKDCASIEKFLLTNKLKINDNQFSALVCFAYNVGVSPIISKGRSLCDALILNSNTEISKAFKLYVKGKANGKMAVVRGLVRRREAEAKLYFS
jgi:lysozyme